MSFSPGARSVAHRTAIGASLVLALSGVAAAPSQAATSAPARSSATCPGVSAETGGGAAVGAGSAQRSARQRPRDGMEISRSTAAAVQRQMSDRVSARSAQALANNSIAVPVVAHILLGRKKRAAHMTRAGIDDQLTVLNQAYSGAENPGVAADTPFRFVLRKVTRTRNQKWYRLDPTTRAGARAGDEMKRRLHRGSAHTLNLYFVKFGSGLLGYSTFPWNAHGKKLKLDGTVIDYRSRPGGELAGFNQGDTGTHEVGHWLGLLHTFQGGTSGCGADPAGSGDFVADTPAEAQPTSGCPVDGPPGTPGVKDTCTGDSQTDPIHNFMDYGSDACMYTFTPGQVDRMSQAWLAFRA